MEEIELAIVNEILNPVKCIFSGIFITRMHYILNTTAGFEPITACSSAEYTTPVTWLPLSTEKCDPAQTGQPIDRYLYFVK